MTAVPTRHPKNNRSSAAWLAAIVLASCSSAVPRAARAQPPSAERPPASEPSDADRDQLSRSEYRFGEGDICPFCRITPQFPEGRSGLHWHDHWSAVGMQEYVTIPLLAATALGTHFFVEPPRDPDWTSPILFDASVRDALRLENPGLRSAARTLSDVILVISYTQPYVVDTLIVTWWVRQAPRVAWQMFVINSQAYAFSFAANAVTKRLTSRARPWVESCDRDPSGESCGSGERYRSFYSGHAATTATGAGLVCAHHTQLSLYGNPALDTATCVTAVLGTAVTGAMRIASDNHWASDVIVGHLMGYVSGYLLPTLMYYKEFRITPEEDTHPDHEAPPQGPTFAVLPQLSESSIGALVLGSF